MGLFGERRGREAPKEQGNFFGVVDDKSDPKSVTEGPRTQTGPKINSQGYTRDEWFREKALFRGPTREFIEEYGSEPPR